MPETVPIPQEHQDLFRRRYFQYRREAGLSPIEAIEQARHTVSIAMRLKQFSPPISVRSEASLFAVWKCHGAIASVRIASNWELKPARTSHVPKCGYIGLRSSFEKGVNGPKCPKCGQDDCTFPYRLFRCKKCGKTADQETWFPEYGLDHNPLKEGAEPEACEGCLEKLEAPIGEVSEQKWHDHEQEFKALGQKPAELEEVPVEV